MADGGLGKSRSPESAEGSPLPRAAAPSAAAPRVRLLALDIDGTLVTSRDELSPRVRQAIERAMRAGIQVVLATGRRYSRALPLAQELILSTPLVTASGALIKSPLTHRTLHSAEFEPNLLRGVLRMVHQRGYEPVVYADSYDDGFDFYCPRLDTDCAELRDYLQLNPGCGRARPELMSDPPRGTFGLFATGGREAMFALGEALHARFPEQLYVHVSRSYRYIGHMCEISPAGHTKWSGVQFVAREWGIADEEVCAVGDDHNDLPMLQGAGVGVAMGNALDEVKAAAHWTTHSHDEDGLATVIDWLLASQ